MIYNTKYICKYNALDIFQEDDDINDNDKEFVKDSLYRSDILNIFNIEDFNEDIINKGIHEIYNKIKDNYEFKTIMKKFAKLFFSEDCELGLLIMFSYDYLQFTHPCISDFLESGQISLENLNKLKKF